MNLTPNRITVSDVQKDIQRDRNTFIGGSDAGTILGVNPWKSAYTLWAEKTGRKEVPDLSDLERIRLGNDLEEYVASRFMEATGKKVRRDNSRYFLAEYPQIVGHIDRRFIGEKAGLEIKTTSQITKTEFEKGDIPMTYYCQCLHYMAVTGFDHWYLAILSFQRGFFWFRIDRNEDEIDALINAELEFWEHVSNNTMPPIDGSDSTADTIQSLYPDAKVEATDIESMRDTIEMLESVKDQIKALETLKKEYESLIKDSLKFAENGLIRGYRVTWKNVDRESFDSKKFKADHPDMYQEYVKQSRYRTLRVEKKEEKENDRK